MLPEHEPMLKPRVVGLKVKGQFPVPQLPVRCRLLGCQMKKAVGLGARTVKHGLRVWLRPLMNDQMS